GALAGCRLILGVEKQEIVQAGHGEALLIANAAVGEQNIEAAAVVVNDLWARGFEARRISQDRLARTAALAIPIGIALVAVVVVNEADAIGIAVGQHLDDFGNFHGSQRQ